jgi:hypothetical protein
MAYPERIKIEALERLQHEDVTQVSKALDIPETTLKRWQQQHHERRAERLIEKIETLHEQLADDALQLAATMVRLIDDAPLNQVSSALGVVIDRFLKVEDYLKQTVEQHEEKVIRFEYKYPDGSIHGTPPWATDDPERDGAVSGGGVRSSLRQDGDGQDSVGGAGAARRANLVASAYVHDGEPGLARSESGAASGYGSGD